MKSNRAPLFYIIEKSNLTFSQKNELFSIIFDAEEDKIGKIQEEISFIENREEKVKKIASYFGIEDVRFTNEEPNAI